MEVDEMGVAYPRKCQLTMMLTTGQTIQVMVAEYASEVQRLIEEGRASGKIIILNCIPKDERIATDVSYFIPENILSYSLLQPKPESRIRTLNKIQPA